MAVCRKSEATPATLSGRQDAGYERRKRGIKSGKAKVADRRAGHKSGDRKAHAGTITHQSSIADDEAAEGASSSITDKFRVSQTSEEDKTQRD